MILLPIVTRELRVACRRSGTYWARLSAAVVTSLFCGWLLLSLTEVAAARLGKRMFTTVAVLSFLYVFFAGIRYTSDCISSEKREGTLGLLFLTDLRGYDVVLGKMAATSVPAVYGLLAVVPVMAISIPLGGVSAGEFWRVLLVLGVTLSLSMTMGVFCSSLVQRSRLAASLTFLGLVFIACGIPCITLAPSLKEGLAPTDPTWMLLSPIYAMSVAFDELYLVKGWGGPNYWVSLGIQALWSVLFLSLASRVTMSLWRDRPAGKVRLEWRERWKQWCYGGVELRTRFRRELLNRSPMLWLAGRDRLKPAYVWGLFGVLLVLWVWGALHFREDWFDEAVYIMTGMVLHLTLKFWVAGEAGQRFIEDRRQNSLELLLSTPLREEDVVRGQLLALRRQFQGPTLVTIVVTLVLAVTPFFSGSESQDAVLGWFGVFLMSVPILVLDLWALAHVGMWLGLTSPAGHRVSGGAILRVLVIPWVAHAGVLVTWQFLDHFGILPWISTGSDDAVNTGLWIVLGFGFDLFWINRSRRLLLQEMREVAAARYSGAARPGLVKRMIRWILGVEAKA